MSDEKRMEEIRARAETDALRPREGDILWLLDRLAEAQRELAEARAMWRCFHCGFETSDRKEAHGHFGEFGEEAPLCVIWGQMDAQERISELQNVSGQLLETEEENSNLRAEIEGLEYRVDSQLAEIHSFKPFRECDTIQQVFNVYDSLEGRALLAAEQLAEARKDSERLKRLIDDTPNTCEMCGSALSELYGALRKDIDAAKGGGE